MQIQAVNILTEQNINTQNASKLRFRYVPQCDTVSFGSIFSRSAKKPQICEGARLDDYIVTDEQDNARKFIENSGKTADQLLQEAKTISHGSQRFKQIASAFQVLHKEEGEIKIEPLLAHICHERGDKLNIICKPTVIEDGHYVTRVVVNNKPSFEIIDGTFVEKDIERLKAATAQRFCNDALEFEKKEKKSYETRDEYKDRILRELTAMTKGYRDYDKQRSVDIQSSLQAYHYMERDKRIGDYIGELYPGSYFRTFIDDDMKLTTETYFQMFGRKVFRKTICTYYK